MARLRFPAHAARLPRLADLPETCAGSDEGVERNGERHQLIKQDGQHRPAQLQQQDGTRLASRMDRQAAQQQQ